MHAKWIAVRPWLGMFIRLALGAMFFIAGWLKLPNLEASVRAVRAYQLLPEAIVPTLGYALPVLEVLLGTILLLGIATRIGAILSAAFMIVFTFAIASAAIRGLSIDCGCFGAGGEVAEGEASYTLDIVRDLVALAGSILLMIWPRTALSVDGLLRKKLAFGNRHDSTTSPENTREEALLGGAEKVSPQTGGPEETITDETQ